LADEFERAGDLLWPTFGGLVMMEAVKRLAAEPPTVKGRVVRARARAPAAKSTAQPSPHRQEPPE
jgi:hypothetical protein